jgi:streptomycin 6-kinase
MGESGAAWVAGLPALIADVERDWSITVGRPLPGGSSSYVARAMLQDGSSAVLKLPLVEEGLAQQTATLDLADGRGYARLLRADLDRPALLLEALGPALSVSRLEPERQLAVLAETLHEAWLPHVGPPPDLAQDKAASLYRLISDTWLRLGRPCPEEVIERALGFAEDLVGGGDLVVVHGDPHPGNALRAPGGSARSPSGYLFVDPDGFVADRAYDLGVALRDWCGRLTGQDARSTLERYCNVLAEHSGADPDRIWCWGFVERVSTGLYVLAFGAEAVGRPFLDSAARLLD